MEVRRGEGSPPFFEAIPENKKEKGEPEEGGVGGSRGFVSYSKVRIEGLGETGKFGSGSRRDRSLEPLSASQVAAVARDQGMVFANGVTSRVMDR